MSASLTNTPHLGGAPSAYSFAHAAAPTAPPSPVSQVAASVLVLANTSATPRASTSPHPSPASASSPEPVLVDSDSGEDEGSDSESENSAPPPLAAVAAPRAVSVPPLVLDAVPVEDEVRGPPNSPVSSQI